MRRMEERDTTPAAGREAHPAGSSGATGDPPAQEVGGVLRTTPVRPADQPGHPARAATIAGRHAGRRVDGLLDPAPEWNPMAASRTRSIGRYDVTANVPPSWRKEDASVAAIGTHRPRARRSRADRAVAPGLVGPAGHH